MVKSRLIVHRFINTALSKHVTFPTTSASSAKDATKKEKEKLNTIIGRFIVSRSFSGIKFRIRQVMSERAQ